MVINTYLSIITLNVHDLNASIKRHRVSEWLRKQDSYIWLFIGDPPQNERHRLKVKVYKKILHANGNVQKAGGVILTSDKIDLKTRAIVRDKEVHHIMIKGSVH